MASKLRIASIVLAVLCASCESGGTEVTEVPPRERPDTMPPALDLARPCDRWYYQGDSGCARIVVILKAPAEPLPTLYRLQVKSWFANPRDEAALAPTTDQNPRLHPLMMTVMRRNYSQPPPVPDTASIWVIARLLEDVRPVQVGVPLPVFAADSVLITSKFTPVGSVPRVDTVQLVLKRP